MQVHVRHQRKGTHLECELNPIVTDQFCGHLHIFKPAGFHQCHNVLIGTPFQVHVTRLESNIGVHIALGHIANAGNIHSDLGDIALSKQRSARHDGEQANPTNQFLSNHSAHLRDQPDWRFQSACTT